MTDRSNATQRRRTKTCKYCGKPIDLSQSFGQDKVSGAHFHFDCFARMNPRGREILERATQLADETFQKLDKRRLLH
jgi:hypothetical protein